MSNCSKCGAVLTPGTRFCTICGNPIAAAPAAPAAPQAPQAPVVNRGPIPQAPYAAPQAPVPGFAPAPKAPKAKKPLSPNVKSAIWFGTAALAVVLVFVIGLMIILNTSSNTVLRATEKSLDAAADYFDDYENMHKAIDNLVKLTNKGQFHLEGSLYAYGDYATLKLDTNGKAASGALQIPDAGSMSFYADSKDFMFRVPSVRKPVGFPLKNFAKNWNASVLGQNVPLPEDMEINPFGDMEMPYADQIDEILDAIHFEEADTFTWQLGGKDRKCTAYDLTFDHEALADALNEIPDIPTVRARDLEEADGMLQLVVDNRGYLIGVNIHLNDYMTGSIRLEGKENIWDEIVFYTVYTYPGELPTEEVNAYATVDADKSGFTLLFTENGDSHPSSKIDYDDNTGTLSIGTYSFYRERYSYEYIYLTQDDDTTALSFSIDNVTFNVSISPMVDKPERLADSYDNILEMDERQLMALLG